MSGGDLTGAKLDAALLFPVQIKQVLAGWRSDFPETSIDDRDVQVIEGTSDGRTPLKLFFDKQSGLLVRQVHFNDTAVGLNPTQIDYSDYREVFGVRVPFHWTVTWTDGQSAMELSDVQANVPIDAAKFGKPAPPPREATP